MTDQRRNWRGIRVGYVPYTRDLSSPGDRRRFCFYASKRGIDYSIAEPDGQFDLVVISSRADIARWADAPRRVRLVYELIDSYMSIPRSSPKAMLRGTAKYLSGELSRPVLDYRRAIRRMCRRADAMVCSTLEQKATYERLCPNVHIILDDHSEFLGRAKCDYGSGETLSLLWEGQAHTLPALRQLSPVLKRMAADRPVQLRLVTDLRYPRYANRFVWRDARKVANRIHESIDLEAWSVENLRQAAAVSDIAVIPLDLEDPFSAGKPENKLLIFWQLGLPTVTSATAAYVRTQAAAGLDLTCRSADDWLRTLTNLAGDEPGRRNAAEAQLSYIRETHDPEALLDRWDRLFESVL